MPAPGGRPVIDVYVSTRRDSAAARYFFARALAATKVILVV